MQKDKHSCFSAENFRNQDKLIRFCTGTVNWNVFLQFTFLVDRSKGMKYWRSDINVEENCQHELRQERPRSLSMLDECFLTLIRLRHAFPEEHLCNYQLKAGGGGRGGGRAWGGDLTLLKNLPSNSQPTGKPFQSNAQQFHYPGRHIAVNYSQAGRKKDARKTGRNRTL